MTPGPVSAALLLHSRIELEAKPRNTLDVLSELVELEGWKGKYVTSFERAESWHSAFKARLRDDLSELNRWGRFCPYTFNSSDDTLIQGGAFIEPSDSESARTEKSRRARFQLYVEALNALSPRDLERLCAGLLGLLKVDAPQVTQYSADRGVDFYGKLQLAQHIFPNTHFPHWHRQLNTWLIGQAKHYVDGTVSTPALRDLVGAITLLRGSNANRKGYPTLILKSCDPVFMLLVTTGRLSRDVWDEVERSGAVGIDGEMLASFLASQAVGCIGEDFKNEVFYSWLSGFDPAPADMVDAEHDS